MQKQNDDNDLFTWADSKPKSGPHGIVIDATNRFLAREMAFLRIIALGYDFPTSGGAPPIELADVRERKRQARVLAGHEVCAR